MIEYYNLDSNYPQCDHIAVVRVNNKTGARESLGMFIFVKKRKKGENYDDWRFKLENLDVKFKGNELQRINSELVNVMEGNFKNIITL